MKTIRFGSLDSYEDLNLILTSSQISAPSLKEKYIDVDGADGSIDYTQCYGRIFYEDRDLQFEFTYGGLVDYAEKFSEIQNKLHGKKFDIRISDDLDWFYVGRVTVDKWKSSKAVRNITVTCRCEPYKYKVVKRVHNIETNPQTIRFRNDRMIAKPTFIGTVGYGLQCNGDTIQLAVGVERGGLTFLEGDNDIIVSGGSGVLTINCTVGSL